MNSQNDFRCLNCGSESFVSEPNRYDLLKFINGDFEVIKSEFTDNKFKIFCRECSLEIDEKASVENEKVILNVT